MAMELSYGVLGAETDEASLPGLRLTMDVFGEQIADGVRPPERRVGVLGKIAFR